MSNEYRLPRTVIPSRYELRLAPDLETAAFTGDEIVTVDVAAPVSAITLNAIDLALSAVAMVDNDGTSVAASTVDYDAERERVTLQFPIELSPGRWYLHASFTGTLNDDLRGFYRSTYKDSDGKTCVIATTQFQATDARRAFPCWDEPDLKAVFEVTLITEPGLVAIANAHEVEATATPEGKVAHRYAPTMVMSTYLVAFVVGDFEIAGPVDAGGTPLRVIHTPGKAKLADFALEIGAFALDYFTEYYGIAYPGDKLDLIGIPDFAAGAMENLGAVTFRETALLVDRSRATQDEMARVADVVAHELAHMWFGDLVTMKWWNGIWLNEAFATFMELKCVDAFRPEWKRWLSFAHFRAQSMDVDGLAATRPVEFPVDSPDEANAMFDTLTYGKGSAVLRMLEQYLGEDAFRRGIRAYLEQHSYGNTETDDLWEALEAVSGEPVGDIMSGWIYQGGYPQLDVVEAPGGFVLRQEHFRFLGEGESIWQVPALYRSGGRTERIVVTDDVVIDADDDLLVNSGGDGFYRVRYTPGLLASLGDRLASLAPAERYTLLADTWASVLSGDNAAADFVDLVTALAEETEPDVWGVAIGGLAELSRVISSDDRPDLQRLVRNLVGRQNADLGWKPRPGETDLDRKLRGLLLRTAGNFGDDVATQAMARDVFDQVVAEPGTVDADVADAAVGIVATNGGPDDFSKFLTLRDQAKNPQDELRYLRAAAAVPDPATAAELIRMVLAGEIRSQDGYWVLARLLGHRDTGVAAWQLVKENWDECLSRIPPQNRRRILDLIMYRSEPDVAADIEAWLANHPIPGAAKSTAQQLERLTIRVGLREREGVRLGESLRG